MTKQRVGRRPRPLVLYVEVSDVERVGLDERPARLDEIAHQRREEAVGFVGILDAYLQERAAGRIHGGYPELLRIHLDETLVAIDGQALLADLVNPIAQLFEAVELDPLRPVLEHVRR